MTDISEVARLLGVSRAHAALLKLSSCPETVLENPASAIGPQWPTVFAFWRHLDRMTPEQWAAARTARDDAAGNAAWVASGIAAGAAARTAAGAATWDAARASTRGATWNEARASAVVAAGATNEIQGAAVMSRPFFFLPRFGFSCPEAVLNDDE